MNNLCIYCGKKLIGRNDKRFCDNQCRNAWHNSNPNQSEAFIKSINKTLRKNRSILRFASPEGKTTVRKHFLLELGFDFNYFTNLYTSNNKNTYRLCYDYGYLLLEDKKVLIVRWQQYMGKKK